MKDKNKKLKLRNYSQKDITKIKEGLEELGNTARNFRKRIIIL